jgi:hypothetical protein
MKTVDEILAEVEMPPAVAWMPQGMHNETIAWGRAIAEAALKEAALQRLSDLSQELGGYDDPKGWQWVPKEPTTAMLRAAVINTHGPAVYKVTTEIGLQTLEADEADAYCTMLAAAPKRIVAEPPLVSSPIETLLTEYAAESSDFSGQAGYEFALMLARRYAERGPDSQMRCVVHTLLTRIVAEPALCHCKDRPADQCPGEWEPGCDLGNNEKHIRVAEPTESIGSERKRLRAAQAEAVMPLVGPLLDAYEGCSQSVRSEHPELDKQLRRINRAMEDAGEALMAVPEPAEASSWDESSAVSVAHASGFAGTSWIMGPEKLAHLLSNATGPRKPAPIDMVLHCSACGLQHVDEPEAGAKECVLDQWAEPAVREPWTNPPHRSHLCAGCGHIWRPADVPTNGVQAIKTKGKADSAPTPIKKPTEPFSAIGIDAPHQDVMTQTHATNYTAAARFEAKPPVTAQIGAAEQAREVPAKWVNMVMEQAQVFASSWALVGTRFDSGDALEHAEAMKAELREMLVVAPEPVAQEPVAIAEAVEHNKTLADLLRRTANALRGLPPPFIEWGWRDLPERAAAAAEQLRGIAPPGYKLVAVKGLSALIQALDRAERKGYLPDAMADEWEAFEWSQPVAALTSPQPPREPTLLQQYDREQQPGYPDGREDGRKAGY